MAKDLKNCKVLYVEDDDTTRELLSIFLGFRFGAYDVAENGKVGLDRFESESPDIVITDIMMPVMNGLEMAKRIRSINGDTPIIFTTAYTDSDYIGELKGLGFDHIIPKPIDTEELVEVARQIMKSEC